MICCQTAVAPSWLPTAGVSTFPQYSGIRVVGTLVLADVVPLTIVPVAVGTVSHNLHLFEELVTYSFFKVVDHRAVGLWVVGQRRAAVPGDSAPGCLCGDVLLLLPGVQKIVEYPSL